MDKLPTFRSVRNTFALLTSSIQTFKNECHCKIVKNKFLDSKQYGQIEKTITSCFKTFVQQRRSLWLCQRRVHELSNYESRILFLHISCDVFDMQLVFFWKNNNSENRSYMEIPDYTQNV